MATSLTDSEFAHEPQLWIRVEGLSLMLFAVETSNSHPLHSYNSNSTPVSSNSYLRFCVRFAQRSYLCLIGKHAIYSTSDSRVNSEFGILQLESTSTPAAPNYNSKVRFRLQLYSSHPGSCPCIAPLQPQCDEVSPM